MKKLLIILIALLIAGPAHAAVEGITLEDGTGYIFMENSGYVLLETATASSPTSGGINPALLFIILDD